MAERQRARHVEGEKVEEVVVEESTVLSLYSAILKKVDEMSVIALGLESGPETVEVLSQLAMIRVTVNGCIEKARELEQMEEDARRYEEGKVGGKKDE